MYSGGVVEDTCLGLAHKLALVSGEEHQLAEVVLQSGLVGLEALLIAVLAPVVNGNADRPCELHAKPNCPDLVEGESTSEAHAVLVPNRLSTDGGSQFVEGTGGCGCGLGASGLQSSAFASGLVEPGAHVALPVLPEVDVGNHVVMLNHWPITL